MVYRVLNELSGNIFLVDAGIRSVSNKWKTKLFLLINDILVLAILQ